VSATFNPNLAKRPPGASVPNTKRRPAEPAPTSAEPVTPTSDDGQGTNDDAAAAEIPGDKTAAPAPMPLDARQTAIEAARRIVPGIVPLPFQVNGTGQFTLNADEAIGFLSMVRPVDDWQLVAICPVNGITGETFSHATGRGCAIGLKAWQSIGRSCYLHVNRFDPSKKTNSPFRGDRQSIRWIDFAHADVDPLAGESPNDVQQRVTTRLAALGIDPTFLNCSGRGCHVWLRYATPLEANEETTKRAQAINKRLCIAMGIDVAAKEKANDPCWDTSRILKIPGCVSFKKNLPALPAYMVKASDSVFTPDQLETLLPELPQGVAKPNQTAAGQAYRCDAPMERLETTDDLPRRVLKWQRTMILDGYDPNAPDAEIVKGFNAIQAKRGLAPADNPYGSRSNAVFATIGYCKYAGVSDGILINILSDARWKISAHCREKGGENEARRQIEHWRDKHPDFNPRGMPPADAILEEPGGLLASIKAMEDVLLGGDARPIYQRGEFLVRPATIGSPECGEPVEHVTTDKDDGRIVNQGGIKRVVGTSTIRRLSAGWIQREVAAHSKWIKPSEKGFSPTDPPQAIATHILDKVGEWRFPLLNGIINTPTIRPDGSLLNVSGYDATTGLLLDTMGVAYPPVKDHPTIEDAKDALGRIRNPFRDYKFAKNGSESVHCAAILMAIYRPMMRHAPMIDYDAPTPGSGKGKLAKCVGIMALGKPPAHMNMNPKDDEFIKLLSSVLLAGDPVIWIDNISRPIGGIDLLDSAITEPVAKIRILGVSETQDCPCRALLLGTGNNITFKGDMPRRALVCRIDSDAENPEETKFSFDPVEEFSTARPQMVTDALTILRGYILAGRPDIDKLKPFGSFNDFDVIRGALVWAGMPDPCNTRIDIVAVDDTKSYFAEMVSEWYKNFGETPKTMNEIRVASNNDYNPYQPLLEAMLLATRQPQPVEPGRISFDARLTGRRLDAWKGKVVRGLKFDRAGEKDHAALWQVTMVERQMTMDDGRMAIPPCENGADAAEHF
jgi:hypothetical protein